MFKLKMALVAALVGILVTAAAISIHADGSNGTPHRTTSARINTLDLMSNVRDLPDRTIGSPI